MTRLKMVLWTCVAAVALSIAGGSFAQSVAAQVRAALVRDVDSPALQPFRATNTVSMNAINVQTLVTTVPAGKRLVIDSLTYSGFAPGGIQFIFGGLRSPQFGQFQSYVAWNPPHASATSSFVLQDGAQSIRATYEAGEEVWLSISATTSSTSAQITVTTGGYFITP